MKQEQRIFSPYLEWLDEADHTDVKVIESSASLKEFVAAFLSYRPWLVQKGYDIRRWQLTRAGFSLDLNHADDQLTAESLPLEAGEKATFFDVLASDCESYWVAECPESHVRAALGVLVSPTSVKGMHRYHVGTAVQYLGWRGQLEFNMVRPFHHLLVNFAIRHAAA